MAETEVVELCKILCYNRNLISRFRYSSNCVHSVVWSYDKKVGVLSLNELNYLLVSVAGSIDLPIFSEATDDEFEATISIVRSYDKKQMFWA